MKLEIDIPSIIYNDAKENRGYISVGKMEIAWKAIADGKPLEQEPCEDISPTAIPLTVEEAKKLLYAEWKREVQKDNSNNRLLVAYKMAIKALEQEPVLDKIRAEILDCLKALDEVEKSGLSIYLPNEISGRRLTYQQCLGFIDKYKAESEK